MKNFCEDLFSFFFFGDRLKNFCEDLFFGEHLRLCPWSLALASSIPVLGLESVCPRKGCPWPQIFFVALALASSIVSSTPPLLIIDIALKRAKCDLNGVKIAIFAAKLQKLPSSCWLCPLCNTLE